MKRIMNVVCCVGSWLIGSTFVVQLIFNHAIADVYRLPYISFYNAMAVVILGNFVFGSLWAVLWFGIKG